MKFNTNLFEMVAPKQVKRSYQDLTHEWKHGFQPGDLVPFLMIPTLPGDDLNVKCHFYFQFNPLYYPIIHRMKFHADLVWVPNRIMWPAVVGDVETGWENWIRLANEVNHPTVDVEMAASLTTADDASVMGYMGVPYLLTDVGTRTTVISGLNAFPPMAYLHYWDYYQRNTQLEEPRAFPLVAGDNTAAMQAAYAFYSPLSAQFKCLPAKWEKDYFTSQLPQPQLGDPVRIPLVDTDNVPPGFHMVKDYGGNPAPAGDLTNAADGNLLSGANPVYIEANDVAASVRDLTLATVLQGFRETLMRIKQTYRDYIKAIFSEDPTPMDVQIPVLFGSYSGSVNVSTVMTQATIDSNAQPEQTTGQYTGHMNMFEGGQSFRFSGREHGVMLGVMSLVPNTGYGQGINKYWRYSTPYDYPMDIFCSVGDQEVLNEEIFYQNKTSELAKNQRTFGYLPKYSEARTIPNNFGGSGAANQNGIEISTHLGRWWNPVIMVGAAYDANMTLDEWFVSTVKTASGTSIQGGIRLSHVFQTLTFPSGSATEQIVQGYVLNEVTGMRPLPMYSTPGA